MSVDKQQQRAFRNVSACTSARTRVDGDTLDGSRNAKNQKTRLLVPGVPLFGRKIRGPEVGFYCVEKAINTYGICDKSNAEWRNVVAQVACGKTFGLRLSRV